MRRELYAALQLYVCFGKFITNFTIFENRIFIFSFLDYTVSSFFIYFVFNNILKAILEFLVQ